jgi:hypothetical protein
MIKKSLKANSREITLNSLRQMFGKIYVDEHLLQRLKDAWEAQICSEHIVKFVYGHSNIYSIVLVRIDGCIDYCEELIQKFDESDTQHANIKETITYLEKIKEDGYEYLNLDGQHRVDCYERFLKSEFPLLESVVDEITLEDGTTTTKDLKGLRFNEMPSSTQKDILESRLLITMIEEATLNSLIEVTILTNLGEPWNDHERRIILPSTFNRHVYKYMSENPLLSNMFKEIAKNMSGDYALAKKGDSLMITEWAGYYFNVKKGNHYAWPKKDFLDKQSSIEGIDGQTQSARKESFKIAQLVAELVNTPKNITKAERTTLDNLYILLSVFNLPSHTFNVKNKIISITNKKDFYNWFRKTESFLRDDDYFVKVDGKIVVEPITGKKMTNSESFKRKCGAKKVDDIQLRLEKMVNCFNKDFDMLFAKGIIELIDANKTYTKKQKLTAAIESDWLTADGEEIKFEDLMSVNSFIEGDHIDAVSLGNETTKSNLTLRTKVANIRKSNKNLSK